MLIDQDWVTCPPGDQLEPSELGERGGGGEVVPPGEGMDVGQEKQRPQLTKIYMERAFF